MGRYDGVSFLEEGDLLNLYFPFNAGIVPMRILGIYNKNFDYWAYGPIPASFPDSTGTLHEVGVVPATFVNPVAFQLPNTLSGVQSQYAQDLTWHRSPGLLYHFFFDFGNTLLRIYNQVPMGIPSAELYQTSLNPPSDLGFKAGPVELVSPPFLFTGWFVLNETNMNLRTNIQIRLRAYQVGIVTDPTLVYNMVTRQGEGRNARSISIGGPRWDTRRDVFQAYGLSDPIQVAQIIKSRGQAVKTALPSSPPSGVTYV